MFFSCPHRYSTIEDLEDYIGTLLSLNSSCPTSSVKKIQSLAESVKETNDAFLETKFLIRAVVCNILPPRVRRGATKKVTTGTTKDEDGDSDSDGESEDKPKVRSIQDAEYEDKVLIVEWLGRVDRWSRGATAELTGQPFLVFWHSIRTSLQSQSVISGSRSRTVGL